MNSINLLRTVGNLPEIVALKLRKNALTKMCSDIRAKPEARDEHTESALGAHHREIAEIEEKITALTH